MLHGILFFFLTFQERTFTKIFLSLFPRTNAFDNMIPLQNNEKRGIVIMTLTLAIVLCTIVYRTTHQTAAGKDSDSLSTALPIKQRTAGKFAPRYYAQPEVKRESFPFDPNTADSSQLLRLGLTPSMVRGIYKFRSMGYCYSAPEDFARVPGMTRGLWSHLKPLIRIAPEFQPVELPKRGFSITSSSLEKTVSDTSSAINHTQQTKLKEGEKIDLNTADTTLFKRIPGVGSYYARQLVFYRDKLGGFVSLDQIEEIEGLTPLATNYLKIEAQQIRKIAINKASKNQLIYHPYLRLKRARAVWDYRHAHGPIQHAETLLTLPEFTAEDVQRLLPYLDFSY